MIRQLSFKILDMSLSASVVILLLLAVRPLLKRAPKALRYALWGVVLFRLLCPLELPAPFSLMPTLPAVSQSYTLQGAEITPISAGEAALRVVGDALKGGVGMQQVRLLEVDAAGRAQYVSTDWKNVCLLAFGYLWAAGVALMAFWGLFSGLKLRRRLMTAIALEDRVYLCEGISSPFVLGVFRPKIYLPYGLGEREREYVLLHEYRHLRRGDTAVKLLAYAALCLHWFNPLVWLAFALMSRDMEMSCDEAVIGKLGADARADYSATLLALATGRKLFAGSPLAFGEGDAKGRIRNLAAWKRPALWAVILAAVLCGALAVGLLCSPAGEGLPNKAMAYLQELRLRTALKGWVVAAEQEEEVLRLILRTENGKEVCLLADEKTALHCALANVDTAAFAAGEVTDVQLSVLRREPAGKAKGTQGQQVAAYWADGLYITQCLQREAAFLADGRAVDLMENTFYYFYRLSEGEVLLQEKKPLWLREALLAERSDVPQPEEAVLEMLLQDRALGLGYDLAAELQRAYEWYLQAPDREDFACPLVGREVIVTARSEDVLYTVTEITVPLTAQESGKKCIGTAYDLKTGAVLSPWALFTCPEAQAREVLLSRAAGVEAETLEKMRAVLYEAQLLFYPDRLELFFAAGTLPGEGAWVLALPYEEIGDLLKPEALPK